MDNNRLLGENNLTRVGHKCIIKVNVNDLTDFFYFLCENNIKPTLRCKLMEDYYIISIRSKTKKLSKNVYNILQKWDSKIPN